MKWPVAHALLTLDEEGQAEYKKTGKIKPGHLICISLPDDEPKIFVKIAWTDIRYYFRDDNKLKIIWNDGTLYGLSKRCIRYP